MKSLVSLLVLALLLTGCSKVEKTTQNLQQEKVVLDLMQVQQDQLTALTQKERDLRALEKRSQDVLQDIEQQRIALRRIQKRGIEESQEARDAIAREQASIRTEKVQVDAENSSLRASEARCRQLEHELTVRRADLMRMQSVIQANRRVENAKRDNDRRAVEAKLKVALAARVEKRELALQSLAVLTAGILGSGSDQETSRAELLALLQRSKVAEIEDEGVFVVRARGLAESYYLDKIMYPYTVHKPRAFAEWGQQYLKAEAPRTLG